MNKEFQSWEEFEKDLNITKEQEAEIESEMRLILKHSRRESNR